MSRPPLALTAGDPSGIGPEIAIAAWFRRAENAIPPFYLLSDPASVAACARRLRLDLPIVETTPEEAAARFPDALPVVPLAARFSNTPGLRDKANADGIVDAIDRAETDT